MIVFVFLGVVGITLLLSRVMLRCLTIHRSSIAIQSSVSNARYTELGMNEHSAQTIATDMTLVVVALLATTLIVVVPTWKRFETYWKETPIESWRRIIIASAICVGLSVLLIVAGYVSLLISVDTWYYAMPDVVLLIALVLTIPVYFYVLPRWLLRELLRTHSIVVRARRIGANSTPGRWTATVPNYFYVIARRSWRGLRHFKKSGKSQPDISKEVGTVSALGCFVITIYLTLFIAMASIPIAVGVNIEGQPQQDDFEYSRAMIVAMPYTLASGLMWLGFSYYQELRQGKPVSKE